MVSNNSPVESPPSRPVSLSRLLTRLLLLFIILVGLLLLAAGRWDWIEAWSFSLAFCGFLLFYGIRTMHRDPGQLAERSQRKANVKGWDRVIMTIYSFLLLGLILLAGLDAGRFHWSRVSLLFQITGGWP